MLIGHQRLWNFLTRSAAQQRLAHAYLFIGPARVGKLALAQEFSQWLFCSVAKKPCGLCRNCKDLAKNQHPDFLFLTPPCLEKDGIKKTGEIGIDAIRELQKRFSFFPYNSSHKIAIIDQADRLTTEAASAFLKTLEEPSPQSLIFLVSSQSAAMLTTLVSRCQTIKFLPVPEAEMTEGLAGQVKKLPELAEIIKLAAGRPGFVLDLINRPDEIIAYKADQQRLLGLMRASWPERFV